MGSNSEVEQPKSIVFYDGVCNMCNAVVKFILKNEKESKYQFAALQSDFATSVLSDYSSLLNGVDSIVVLENDQVFYKSVAAMHISRSLNAPWRWISIFSFLPVKVSDFFYDLIARNRYSMFGKNDSCMIPNESIRARFLDN